MNRIKLNAPGIHYELAIGPVRKGWEEQEGSLSETLGGHTSQEDFS